MKNCMYLLSGIFFLIFAQSPVKAEIQVNTTNGKEYHHVLLTLTEQDLLPNPEGRSEDLAYTLADGGMFEIYIPSNRLSDVASPDCDALIVRMPWTSPDLDPEFIAEKAQLLEDINNVRDGRTDTVTIAVELDPYLDTSDNTFTLTQCNVFFRTAYGRYVSNVDPLQK